MSSHPFRSGVFTCTLRRIVRVYVMAGEAEEGSDVAIDASSVLGKARLILDVLEDQLDASLTEIADASGLPKPTVHRVASDLVEWGLVEREGDRYRLGLRLFELGLRAPRGRTLATAARGPLRRLAVDTRETVHLGVLAGDTRPGGPRQMLYLDKVVGPHGTRLPTRTGGRMPVHCTALGRALLSGLDEQEADEIAGTSLPRVTRHTITSRRRFHDVVRAAADDGYAVEQEESLLGVACVGSPIRDGRGRVVGAVSVAAPTHRSSFQALGRRVVAAAQEIAGALGPAAAA